ncbi:MAG TPA: hypothetical protein VHH33_06995 [Nitrososphaeraceae archaeon]|nr:hypothetical protein [Nitrososphaeraceae archaeon]
MKKKATKNGTNTGDKVTESITDKDSSMQYERSYTEIPTTNNNIKSVDGEKTVRKSNSSVKIEDYDLIVNSLKDATTSFKAVILSIGKKAQEIRDKAEETFTVGAKKDARDIQALGSYVENVVKGFEDTMMEIKKRNYGDEEKLLKGYKKLLEEQINVINARIQLVKRLKSR